MEKIKTLMGEIEHANPIRKMSLAQELLPLIVAELEALHARIPAEVKPHAKGK